MMAAMTEPVTPVRPAVPDAPDEGGAREVAGVDQAIGQLEEALLGEPASLSREAVESSTGLGVDRVRALWRALGFVDALPDTPMFAAADVAALQRTATLEHDRLFDERALDTLARALGQAMRRLAEAQVEILTEIMSRDEQMVRLAADDPQQAVREVVEQTREWLPELEALMVYAYRRHVLASSKRVLAGAARNITYAPLVVGFCDIVNYTAMTRDLDGRDLAALVETFESTSADLITRGGGRVVKLLGDEVMFAADDPESGAGIGLALSEAFGAAGRNDVPRSSDAMDNVGVASPARVGEVRVGLAYGPTLPHGGDLFGPVVNLASRCTGIARPGAVVCERELAAALADSPTVRVSRLRMLRVRGYGHLTPSVLRRKP